MPALNGPVKNKFRAFNTMTYGMSMYMISRDQYNLMMDTSKKDVTGMELLIQSGGAATGSPDDGPTDLRGNFGAVRNKFFLHDFFLDDIQLESLISGHSTGGPHNTFRLNFTVTEPMGLTFTDRLYRAAAGFASDKGIENFNPVNQLYLMVIRFYGYDEDGKQVLNGKFNDSSDPNSYIEKWIPFTIAKYGFEVETAQVVYRLECVCPQTQVAHGQIHGTIPHGIGLQGATLKDILGSEGAVGTQNLVTALNNQQRKLVEDGTYEYPDVYDIKFQGDVGLADAAMSPQGTPSIPRSSMGSSTPGGVSTGPASRVAGVHTMAANAGMKIVKFIDLAVRASQYMSGQYKKINDQNKDNSTGKTTVPEDKPLDWFKIRPEIRVTQFDRRRQSWAYAITYIVSAYPVASVETRDFTSQRCITPHKEYDYWFTGQNTEILNLTQTYNNLYFVSFSSKHQGDPGADTDFQINARQQFAHRANSTEAQTSENSFDEQAANAASILYSPADISRVELDILGDPDWLSQSELFYAASAVGPGPAILDDGSANYDVGEIFFSINFNTVVDYSLETGLADVTQENVGKSLDGSHPGGVSQYSFIYRANTIITQFDKGKFTQQLKGTLMQIPESCITGNQAATQSVTGSAVGGNDAASLTQPASALFDPKPSDINLESFRPANIDQGIGINVGSDLTLGKLGKLK